MGNGWTRIGRIADLAQVWGSLPDGVQTFIRRAGWLVVTAISTAIWVKFSTWPYELLFVLAAIVIASVAGTAAAGKYVFRRAHPATEDNEARKKTAKQELTARLREDAARNRALLGAPPIHATTPDIRWLIDLHAVGTDMILNRPISYQHLGRVTQDADTWERIVHSALDRCGASPTELSRFDRLQDRVTPIRAANAVSPEHQTLLNAVNAKLTVLRQITERLES